MKIDALINMFPGKIRVTLIHAVTGQLIGVSKMKIDLLPSSFNKPAVIELEGIKWRIMQADKTIIKEVTSTNKLTLHIQEVTSLDRKHIGSDIPTIHGEYPQLTTEYLFDDFILPVNKEQYRQFEFFMPASLPAIQEEMLNIETILSPGEDINTLLGYKNINIRELNTGALDIDLNDLLTQANIFQKGNISYEDKGFVQNGFALRSENYTYYGIVKNNRVRELNLLAFDSADEEFCRISSTFDLLLADWCNARIILP